jgi:hypothetical protein
VGPTKSDVCVCLDREQTITKRNASHSRNREPHDELAELGGLDSNALKQRSRTLYGAERPLRVGDLSFPDQAFAVTEGGRTSGEDSRRPRSHCRVLQ